MRQRIILAGKAGSGKDYLAEKLVKLGFSKDLSFTTRPKRLGEQNGVDYHYITEKEFMNLVEEDKFYETASFNGWHYGTANESWEKSRVFIMTPGGISKIKPEDRINCLIIYLDISEDIRKMRIGRRSDADSVDRRIEADRADFEKFSDYDAILKNPNFDPEFVLQLWEIVK